MSMAIATPGATTRMSLSTAKITLSVLMPTFKPWCKTKLLGRSRLSPILSLLTTFNRSSTWRMDPVNNSSPLRSRTLLPKQRRNRWRSMRRLYWRRTKPLIRWSTMISQAACMHQRPPKCPFSEWGMRGGGLSSYSPPATISKPIYVTINKKGGTLGKIK